MKKYSFIFIILSFLFNLPVWGINEGQKCPYGFEFKKMENYTACYNEQKQIGFLDYYEDKPRSFIYVNKNCKEGKEKCVHICGDFCDLNGNNCKIFDGKPAGICNPKNCATNYKEIKNGMCYNETQNLSYDYTTLFYIDNKDGTDNMCYHDTGRHNFHYAFYLDGQDCGCDCDFNGRNCKIGVCNTLDCPKGFVLSNQVVATDYCYTMGCSYRKTWGCKNPITGLAFIPNNIHDAYSTTLFSLDGEYCGKNCDLNGANCSYGICQKQICKSGFILRKNRGYGECYNPKTHLSCFVDQYLSVPNSVKYGYSCKYPGWYTEYCGRDCKSDGTDCQVGNCQNKFRNIPIISFLAEFWAKIKMILMPPLYY